MRIDWEFVRHVAFGLSDGEQALLRWLVHEGSCAWELLTLEERQAADQLVAVGVASRSVVAVEDDTGRVLFEVPRIAITVLGRNVVAVLQPGGV